MKLKLHDYLIRLWVGLEDTTIPEVPQKTASWVSNTFLQQFRSSKRIARFVSLFLPASVILTTQALAVGAWMDGAPYQPFLLFHSSASHATLALAVNIFFDALAISFAWFAIWSLKEAKSWRMVAAIAGLSLLMGYNLVEKAFGALGCIFRGFHLYYFFIADRYLFRSGYRAESLYASRLVLPLALFILLIVALYPAKVLLSTSVIVLKFLIKIEAEKQPYEIAPWTFLGILISILGASAKLIADLLNKNAT